ncbi:RBG1 [Symbiodinium natans]|uniref:RBG1 protein n=1 Tax=Symbiodinium natans TaxID=878477 RepID=A0A812IX31_9DINO|nr:RBG1 [Symbiodinium natans]
MAAGKGTGKGATLFVGSLPRTATRESIAACFRQFGDVVDVQLKLAADGLCKGFAFVTFKEGDSALRVLDNYHHNSLDGQWVDCQVAGSKGKGSAVADTTPARQTLVRIVKSVFDPKALGCVSS